MREIGWAVSRFLFPACRAKSGNSADDVQTNIVLLANTVLAPDDSACASGACLAKHQNFRLRYHDVSAEPAAHGRVNELWP